MTLLPTLPSTLRTGRLLLRAADPALAAPLSEAVESSLDHLRASVSWAHHEPVALPDRVAWLAGRAAAFRAGEEWVYLVLDPVATRVLGAVGAEPAGERLSALVGPGAVEIGYWLRADATGRGYASEATEALVRAAFAHLAVARVVVCHHPANAASGAVPRRLGFRCLGTVPDAVLPGREAPDGSVRAATTVWTREPT